MSRDDTEKNQDRRDIFISYTGSDRQWAEWIALQLEEAGYTLFIQAWDFRPGSNFVAEMDNAAKRAERTLLVLSPAYLESDYAFAEWAAAFRHDPRGTHRSLLPVRIELCEVDGLLGQVVYIDLVALDEVKARERLLEGVKKEERVKPATVAFPGQSLPHAHAAFPGSLPVIWNIPYPRNPFFTGRDQELEQLHAKLQQGTTAVVGQALSISGLGGIGKTQLTIEYAYRYREEYQYMLWARAESVDVLIASFTEIADRLNLPEKDAQEQSIMIEAVKRWMQRQRGWLLILDNADSPALLPNFLPPTVGGHLLITTRAADVSAYIAGPSHPLIVETFSDEQGALFLLRRSNLLARDTTLDQAEARTRQLALAIAHELGGLPLALDQAGAYLNVTGSSLTTYQQIYHQHRGHLLAQRRGVEHSESVATTWNISFSKVEQQNYTAADLLRLCAFLAPDAIPEAILTKGAEELGPMLAPLAADAYKLNEAIEALRAYSLITRDPHKQTLTVHRLVQAVLKEAMSKEEQDLWTERTIKAVEKTLPEVTFATWEQCEQWLPHAQVCAKLGGEETFRCAEQVQVAHWTGSYLLLRSRVQEAGPYLQQALVWREEHLSRDHPDTAATLNRLAFWFSLQGRYREAEPLYQRALAIFEQELGATHPDTATNLNNLAALYEAQGRYGEAEPLFKRALLIREQQLGPEHPYTAISLNNLAALYEAQGRYSEAEPLYQRALEIVEQQLGPEHPDTAISLSNLAALYYTQGRYREAEPLLQRALEIVEQQLGPEHPDTATKLDNLALLSTEQRQYGEAEPLFKRALLIREQQLGPEHPDTAISLSNLAALYYTQGRYREAEPLLQRALEIAEQQLGQEHPMTQTVRKNYAILRRKRESKKKRRSWKRVFGLFSR